MLGYNAISRCNRLGLDIDDLGVTFYHFGTTFGVNFVTLSLVEHLGGTFRIKKHTGAPKVPQGAPGLKTMVGRGPGHVD